MLNTFFVCLQIIYLLFENIFITYLGQIPCHDVGQNTSFNLLILPELLRTFKEIVTEMGKPRVLKKKPGQWVLLGLFWVYIVFFGFF